MQSNQFGFSLSMLIQVSIEIINLLFYRWPMDGLNVSIELRAKKVALPFFSTILIAGSFDDARPFHFMRMQSKFIKKISEIVGHISGFICKFVHLIVQTK